MQQMYYCPICHQQVSYGLRFCGNCGNPLSWEQQTPSSPTYQQPVNYEQQVSPSYQQSPSFSQQQQHRMNWFQRHLNWTWILGFLLVFVVALVAGFIVGMVGANVSDSFWDAFGWIVYLAILLPLSGWVIKQKGRSLWWILLSGWFSPLWLGNKKR